MHLLLLHVFALSVHADSSTMSMNQGVTAQNLYPSPGTVSISEGRLGFSSIFLAQAGCSRRLIDQNADVTSVCEGTGKKNDLDYYLARARRTGDFHGQAPVLWCVSALLR